MTQQVVSPQRLMFAISDPMLERKKGAASIISAENGVDWGEGRV